eukprot:7698179-Pyramimonas_sp.AAC.1
MVLQPVQVLHNLHARCYNLAYLLQQFGEVAGWGHPGGVHPQQLRLQHALRGPGGGSADGPQPLVQNRVQGAEAVLYRRGQILQ